MPVEKPQTAPDAKRRAELRLALYDARQKRVIPETGTPIGYNGYADLSLEGPNLTMEHWDIDGTLLVREKWMVQAGGMLRCVSLDRFLDAPGLVLIGDPLAAMA